MSKQPLQFAVLLAVVFSLLAACAAPAAPAAAPSQPAAASAPQEPKPAVDWHNLQAGEYVRFPGSTNNTITEVVHFADGTFSITERFTVKKNWYDKPSTYGAVCGLVTEISVCLNGVKATMKTTADTVLVVETDLQPLSDGNAEYGQNIYWSDNK